MIWILLGVWFSNHFGGHSGDVFSVPLEQAKALVKQHVADPSRQKQAVVILDQIAALEKQRYMEFKGVATNLQKVADDRSATSAQFMQLTEVQEGKVVVYQNEIIDLRFKLKNQLTRGEWILVFPEAAENH